MPKPRKPTPAPAPKQKAPKKRRNNGRRRKGKEWTAKDCEKLIRLYSEGVSFEELSEKTGHSGASVHTKLTHLRKEGRIAGSRQPGRWTKEQEATLLEMRAKGMSFGKIGTEIGKSAAATFSKWRHLEERNGKDSE